MEHLLDFILFFVIWSMLLRVIQSMRKPKQRKAEQQQSSSVCGNCGKAITDSVVKQNLDGIAHFFCSFQCRENFVRKKWHAVK